MGSPQDTELDAERRVGGRSAAGFRAQFKVDGPAVNKEHYHPCNFAARPLMVQVFLRLL
jgi:hypothetical protein